MNESSGNPSKQAIISTLNGQEIAKGVLFTEDQIGEFQAETIFDKSQIESVKEVYAKFFEERLHLVNWRRCE